MMILIPLALLILLYMFVKSIITGEIDEGDLYPAIGISIVLFVALVILVISVVVQL